jgi:hypothetical protein
MPTFENCLLKNIPADVVSIPAEIPPQGIYARCEHGVMTFPARGEDRRDFCFACRAFEGKPFGK